MYVRIEYIKRVGVWGQSMLTSDTYVLDSPDENRIHVIIRKMLNYGFVRRGDRMGCDEEMYIAPGAILSMVPCDKAGYSKYDRERVLREEEEGRRG